MNTASLGDLGQSFALRRYNLALKTDLQRLSVEVASGQIADATRALRGDFSAIGAIESTLGRIAGYRSITTEAALFAGAMQTVLDRVDTAAADLAPALLAAANSGTATSITSIGTEAAQKFETAVAAFNTRLGDRTLFAGTETQGAALAGPGMILSALETAVAGAATAADVATAVSAWFADPAGYSAVAYQGGAAAAPVTVRAGETVRIDVTAADPAIRGALEGLALAALLDRGALSGDAPGRAALARRAGEHLLAGATGRADLASRIGTAEGQIAAATAGNSTEATALTIARAGLLEVDPYDSATALTEAQTRLETLYAITARLSRLSLVDYL